MANNSVGTAYLTLVPKLDSGFAKQAEKSLGQSGSDGGKQFEGNFSDKIKDGFKKLAGAAVVIKAGQTIGESFMQAFNGYANFEQLEGGVKKIFGEDVANTVITNARNAFETAGMSANTYMENVTSFSASLVSSLSGNTAEAAKYADKAIRDMSDNANTYGTNIQDIQNAYQGFAKQNYTMLDNLKLGYGGTKQEMQRLLDDAGKLAGTKFNIDSYADVIEAIHVMQESMGIAETTAHEAAGTIEGSVNTMKAAWDNFLVSLGDPEGNIDESMEKLVKSVANVVNNVMKTAGTIVKALATNIPKWMSQAGKFLLQNSQKIGDSIGKIISKVVAWLVQNLPNILKAALTLFGGLLTALVMTGAKVMSELGSFLSQSAGKVSGAVGQMLSAAITWIGGIVTGINNKVSSVLGAITNMISQAPGRVVAFVSNMFSSGVQLIQGVINGFWNIAGNVTSAVWDIVSRAPGAVGDFFWNMYNSGKDLVRGLVDGLLAAPGAVKDALLDLCGRGVEGFKNFFGIHSPSRLMREYGQYIGAGLSLGIEDSESNVDKAMRGLMDTTYGQAADYGIGVNASLSASRKTLNADVVGAIDTLHNDLYAIIKDATPDGITGRQFGRLVHRYA